MGINKIILYDNNDIKDDNLKVILKKYINNNFIELINYRGLFKPQKKAYDDCYNNNKYKYNWFVFYDADEFLYLVNHSTINNFLSLKRFSNCSNILINWKYYGDNGNIYYKPKLMKERFPKPYIFSQKDKKNKYLYMAAKTIVRGGLNITWEHFPHYLKNQIFCRPDGSKTKSYFSEPQYSYAYIKHYTTKSTQEYIEKVLRGGGVTKINSTRYLKHRINHYYFLINKKTKKKIQLFEKALKFKIH